jgi:hypothetical protein
MTSISGLELASAAAWYGVRGSPVASLIVHTHTLKTLAETAGELMQKELLAGI